MGVRNGINQHDRVRHNGGGKTTENIGEFIGEPKRNTERRGEAEKDPVKKAKIAKFIEEWWTHQGIYISGRGGDRVSKDIMSVGKSVSDIADFLGETSKTTQRLLKLNDLTPEIQQLVSDGKLGTTAAEQYAYISQENQRILIDSLGEKLGDKTVVESKEIRKQSESDPVKKGRIANFLKEYWRVRSSGDQSARQNGGRSMKDIQESIGESERNTQRLLKLNDLIPEIQQLVSDGKLGSKNSSETNKTIKIYLFLD